jgi:hypothetical protein
MLRLVALFVASAAVGVVLAATALAQATPAGQDVAQAVTIQTAVSPATGPVGGKSPVKVKAETPPVSMKPMLASQNDARAKLGLAPLSWSTSLQKDSEAAVSGLTGGLCTSSIVRRATKPAIDALYWASPMRSFDGGQKVQDISPGFVVSEWKDRAAGRANCAKDADCNAWALLTRKSAKQVGCATSVCPNQARVWICRYGD